MIDDLASGGRDAVFNSLDALVTLLRQQPDDGAGRTRLLESAVRAAAAATVVLEAGVENSFGTEEAGLKGRLLARRVDRVTIEAGATADELLLLARGLADDSVALKSSPSIRIDLLPVLSPPPAPGRAYDGPRTTGRMSESFRTPARQMPGLPDWMAPPRRENTANSIAETMAQISASLGDEIQRGAWRAALHDVQGLIRLVPAVPEHQRRGFSISVRRYLSRPVLTAFIELAVRTPEEQARTVEVLKWAGLDAAEQMLELLRSSESVGSKEFLFVAIGQMPDALSLVMPFATSPRWHEARHGADILGRMGLPGAVPVLRGLVEHPDERVRLAAVEALGRIPDKAVLEPLRQALTSRSPQMRARAGRALGDRRSGALAMPLLAALEEEKDLATWRELLRALALIDSPEATSALVRVATERKTLFGRSGRPTAQRLEVVQALAAAGTPAAHHALERIAAEGDESVRVAARKELERGTGNGERGTGTRA
jgi:hypothetical protein